jgi:stress response protein YsnF
VIIVPVLEEVLVVEKRLVLKREIRIPRRPTSGTIEIPVSLRKQRVKVERQGGGCASDRCLSRYRTRIRERG